MKPASLLLVSSILAVSLSAQSNFQASHLVLANGTVRTGEIDNREWSTNPREIRFRNSASDAVETLKAHQVQEFAFDKNKEEYRGAIVNVCYRPLDENAIEFRLTSDITRRIPLSNDTNFMNSMKNRGLDLPHDVHFRLPLERDTIFLETLAKGRLNLYQLNDANGKVHFFVQKASSPLEELYAFRFSVSSRIKIQETPYLKVTFYHGSSPYVQANIDVTNTTYNTYVPTSQVVRYDGYKMQLTKLMSDQPALVRDIDRAQLTYSSLLSLVNKYNAASGQVLYTKARNKSPKKFFAFAGITDNRFLMKDGFMSDRVSIDGNLHPSVGLGFDFTIARTLNKLSVSVEGLYVRGSAEYSQVVKPGDGTEKTVNYNMVVSGLRLNTSLKYTPYLGTIQPYLRGGFGLSDYGRREFVPSARMTPTTRTLKKSELTALGGLGIAYKNFFVEGRYESGTDLNWNTNEDLKMHRMTLLLGYSLRLGRP